VSSRETDKKKDWNGDKVRSIQQSKDDSFKLTYIEFLNPAVIAEVFGDANTTVIPATTSHGTQVTAKSNADILGHYAYIVDTLDGNVKKRRCIADAQVESIDDVAEKPGDWSVYTVTYDLYPDSQGNTSYTYYELDDRLVPSTWNVTVAGSAGTYIHTVDSQPTTVGSGNATVTGTPAAYQVILANGGVLTSLGTGGATVTVVAA
jgi:hypothetical protein